jgi:hypothetical protein
MRRFIFLAVAVILIIASGCTEAPGSGPPDEWFALRHEFTAQDLGGSHASFTPAVSGEYAITLNFRQATSRS